MPTSDEQLRDIPYTRPLLPPLKNVQNMLAEIWQSGIVTNFGPVQEEFEHALQEVTGGKDILAVSNGWSAIRLMLTSLDLAGEVIISGFTHPATAQAVVSAGLAPVVADIDPFDLNLSPKSVESILSPRSCAILATHIFGHPADVASLEALAQRHRLPLVFDAASASGVRYMGNLLGEYGTASAFSFHATKILAAIEGGALVSSSASLIRRARELANFGLAGSTSSLDGMNAKINEVTSAVGLCSLPLLESEIQARGRVLATYRELLKTLPEIAVVGCRNDTVPNNSAVAIRVRSLSGVGWGSRVAQDLRQRGIAARRYFSETYAVGIPTDHLPEVTTAKTEVICLPCWGGITFSEIARVCDTLKASLDNLRIEG